MKGTYVERDRKKEKKKPKTTESGGSKKAAAAAAGMAGVPAAMPVSVFCFFPYKPRATFFVAWGRVKSVNISNNIATCYMTNNYVKAN